MRFTMKKSVLLVSAVLLVSNCLAAAESQDTPGNVVETAQADSSSASGAAELPGDVLAEVNELKVKMRYFKAIGFHAKSKEQRDAIAAIYREHGVPLPDEFKD